nr:hypothetical protein [Tanacetum cinerariifolium]
NYFHRLLHLKKAYRITSFSCEQTSPRERTLENPTSLVFRRYIDLIEIPNDNFPEHYFNFASNKQLPSRDDVRIAILTEILNDNFPEHYFNFASNNQLPSRDDVRIAILTAVNRVHRSGDATTNRIRQRTIDIQDLNGNTIVLTPWHEMALDFNVQEYEPMEKLVVIAVSSFWVRQFNGTYLDTPEPSAAVQTKATQDKVRPTRIIKKPTRYLE